MTDWILYIYISSSRFSEVDEDGLDTIYIHRPLGLVK